MTFAQNINRICVENGTNLTSLVKTVKGSSSFATAINKGALPKEEELLAFAEILHCSVMDFFADDDDSDSNVKVIYPDESLELNEDELDFIRIYRSLPRKEKHELMVKVYDFDKEEKE